MDKTLGRIAFEETDALKPFWWSLDDNARANWEAIAAAVAAAVKEEDAKICIDYANRLARVSHHDHPPADEVASDCADEIRASIKEVK